MDLLQDFIEVILMIQKNVDIVLGGQFGDEGKGRIVDYLGHNYDYVVKCMGSQNSGRTVIYDGQKIVFRGLSAALLNPSIKSILGNGLYLNPKLLLSEISFLEKSGISIKDRYYLSNKAHIIFPFHQKIDEIRELAAGPEKIGTTKNGVGPCAEDKFARRGLRFGDIFDYDSCRAKLISNFNYWKNVYSELNLDILEESLEFLSLIENDLKEVIINTAELLNRELSNGKKILLEGAQAHFLDIDHGSYPYVTSSIASVGGMLAGSGLPPQSVNKVFGVFKAYSTRVGGGPFDTELKDFPYEKELAETISQRGQEFGAVTGRRRRIGYLDLVDLKEACQINGVTDLVLTKVDVLDGLNPVMVCIDKGIMGANQKYRQYKNMETWGNSGTAKTSQELPTQLKTFISFIEKFTECQVSMVSVGPERSQMVLND